jgi:cellulose synthase/poly-beta-1,6-N-acetylglucosamine synthase-like glycosyltransferase
MSETLHANARPLRDDVRLSIVTPFHKNDPALLIDILAKQSQGQNIELIIVDDGSRLPDMTRAVMAQVEAFPAPACLITLHTNKGRSGARNRLIAQARARYILFLDSDMAPDTDHFLQDWLNLIDDTMPTIAYGGFTTKQVPDLPELALARALAERVDCQNARQRAARGGLAVATSNLLVRADILQEVSFDSDFTGWGWEDVDWALRAAKAGYAISHVEIPATHMGLDVPEVLLDKFAKAGPNFRLISSRHPDMQKTQGTKMAAILGVLPFQGLIRSTLRAAALNERLPLTWRGRAARAWRAIWAA